MQNQVFILLGSNLGNKQANLSIARQEISRLAGKIVTASSIYKTDPWGNNQQPAFYNQVLELSSSLEAVALLSQVLDIEKKLGRIRKNRWEARAIDIDILFFGSSIIQVDNLTVPHPEIPNRKFTLLPLIEIAPDFIHPASGKTVSQLLIECEDKLRVEKLITQD